MDNCGCEVWLIKDHPTRYHVRFFKEGIQIREQVWKSKTKIRDELRKSGALQPRSEITFVWPAYGERVVLQVEKPSWYWNE